MSKAFKDFAKQAHWEHQYTQDGPLINSVEDHYVFVYGTLKTSFSRSSVLTAQEFIGFAETEFPHFVMYNNTKVKSSYPVALIRPKHEAKAKLRGELFKVDTEIMYYLDMIESNGELYKRTKQFVILNRSGEKCLAWIYLGYDELADLCDKGELPLLPKTRIVNQDYYQYLVTDQ